MKIFKIKIISIGLLLNSLQWIQAQTPMPCDKQKRVQEQTPIILSQYVEWFNKITKAKSNDDAKKLVTPLPSFLERGTVIGGMNIENLIATYGLKKQLSISISDIRITNEAYAEPRCRITIYFTETVAGKSNIKTGILYLYPDNRLTITRIARSEYAAYPHETPKPCVTPSVVDNPPLPPDDGKTGGGTADGGKTGGGKTGGSTADGGKTGGGTASGGKAGTGTAAGGSTTSGGTTGSNKTDCASAVAAAEKQAKTAQAAVAAAEERAKSAQGKALKASGDLSNAKAAAQKDKNDLSFTKQKLNAANQEKKAIEDDRSKLRQRFNDSVSALAMVRLTLQHNEDLLKKARDSIQTEKSEKEHFAHLLRLIRESIAGNVHQMAQLRTIFSAKATELREEFKRFKNKETTAEIKFASAYPKDREKFNKEWSALRAAHEERVRAMWATLESVQQRKAVSETLLYDVYTYSMPERNPKPLPANFALPNPMPTPTQLLTMLQSVQTQQDNPDAHFLKLEIIDDYADIVLPPNPEPTDENQLASASLDCFGKLLVSKQGKASETISSKINDGFIENIMVAISQRQLEIKLDSANTNFAKKSYIDALRYYMDSEKNFDRLNKKNPTLAAQSRYNYGVLLLWNLGGFAQYGKLFRGRTQTIIQQREAEGRRQLLILQRSNNSFKDKAMLALAKHPLPPQQH